MKIVVCYIAVAKGSKTDDYCSRFVATYREYPAGCEHELLIIANGGALTTAAALLFEGLPVRMWPHTNDAGWDISAYIDAAKGPCADADMMVCFGESVYFHQPGWLKRLVEAWEKYGPGMYGPFSSNVIRGHLQTTAFCTSPALLAHYSRRVADRKGRYEFEHGEHSFWRWAARQGRPVRLVTWDGEYPPERWRSPRNILWKGDQTNLLVFANHSDNFREADSARRNNWSRSIDRPFR